MSSQDTQRVRWLTVHGQHHTPKPFVISLSDFPVIPLSVIMLFRYPAPLPLDVAYKLRGAAELCTDMLTDEKYYHDLMTFVTESLITRMKAIRQWRWDRNPDASDKGQFRLPGYGFADDAIALLSVKQYAEFVYPYHKRFFEEFSDGSPAAVHLCGDATRHFKFLRDNLNVRSFDDAFYEAAKEFGRYPQESGGSQDA